jgi:hypothetical protein
MASIVATSGARRTRPEKTGFVADGGGQDEGRAPADLVREKFGVAGIDPRADGRALRGGAEFFRGKFLAAGFRRDGHGGGEIGVLLPFADTDGGEGEADLVAGEAELARGLGDEARRSVVSVAFGLEPPGIEPERGAHHGAAAAWVEAIGLRAGRREIGRMYQRDPPRELSAAGVTGFQLRPGRLNAGSPRRQDFEVVGHFHGRPAECGGCGA